MAEEKKLAAPAAAKVAVKKTNEKLGFFKRIGKWFREMRSELKKVVWPTPKQPAKSTAVAIVIMVAAALVIWACDSFADLIINVLFDIFA